MWLSWQERSPHTIRTFAQSEILQLAYAFRIYLIINFYFYLSRTLYTNKSRHKYGTNIRLKSIENEEIREATENKNSSKLLSYCYLLFIWCSFMSVITSLLQSQRQLHRSLALRCWECLGDWLVAPPQHRLYCGTSLRSLHGMPYWGPPKPCQ